VIAAALRTVAACGLVSAYVLLAGPPILLWTWLSGRPDLLYRAAALGVRVGFALAGIRLRVIGADRIGPQAAVYACNHTSNVDSPAVFLGLRRLFPRLAVLYKAELRKLPVLVWAFDLAGFVPIQRANRDQSWPAIDRAAQALAGGKSFFIFPEGTRSRTGELLPFKKGGFVMAIQAQVPIVPVAVSGGERAMRKGSALIWPATVTLRVLDAVPTAGRTFEDRDAIIREVRAQLESARREAYAAEMSQPLGDTAGARPSSS
jgi:1-acyl-sn-glycerol-3-phosphate acyltransferase